MSEEESQLFLAAIQDQVCSCCPYRISGKNDEFTFCRLPEKLSCTVREFLPQIVEMVQLFEAPSVEGQIVEVRQRVCAKCDRLMCASCPLTGAGICTLDSCLQQVLSALNAIRFNSAQNLL